MTQDWANFYQLLGTAAAALVSLLFVVATLNAGQEIERAMRGVSIFLTPIVLHLSLVLAICAVALAPGLSAQTLGAALALAALVGFAQSARVAWRIRAGETPGSVHWSDVWCYGYAPCASYVALAGVAAGVAAGLADAPAALAATLLGMLLLAIRNAWDLVTWLAPRASGRG